MRTGAGSADADTPGRGTRRQTGHMKLPVIELPDGSWLRVPVWQMT